MQLELYLSSKPLYYEKIDYKRFPRIYKKYEKHFTLPYIVHIVGTNGKGSTGRTLAHLLHVSKKRVGHYSSPHIMKFNERIWMNGSDVTDGTLEQAHKELYDILSKEDLEALSYFEYTTLLAMYIFCDLCDYIILEAGLGGEHDATNVFKKSLSIVTLIDKDHEAFLGESIKDIASTKLRSINNDAILAKQEHQKVYALALKHMSTCKHDLILAQGAFDEQWQKKLESWLEKKEFPYFFKDNFTTAFCAYEKLGFVGDIDLLEGLNIFGRCQKIDKNITIDVGHNPLGAKAILKHFRDKKVKLVYNSYNDKEYQKILTILKPIVDEVLLINIQSERGALYSNLEQTLKDLEMSYAPFKGVTKENEYLVFGSFSVVEAFLKGYFEK